MDERPRNGDTLHLAARELVRITLAEAVELDPREALPGHLAQLRFSCEQQRQFHVFENRQRVQQLKRLKETTER